MKRCVLIVDDEFLISEMLSAMIEDMGLSVCGCATTACEAVRLARLHEPILVLMDVRLKGKKDGVEAALEIRTLEDPSPVIFITGSQEPETVERIKSVGGAGLLIKPFQFTQLKALVEQFIS